MAFCILASCSQDPQESFKMETGKPYALKEWPDSAYLASMDSLVAAEPLKVPDTSTHKAELTISPSSLISTKHLHAQEKPEQSSVIEHAMQGSANEAVAKGAAKHQEDFSERFQKAMEKLQADPSNASLYREVTAQNGDDLYALLKRTYGSEAEHLPAFVVKSQLESINGSGSTSLKPGQSLKVPKL